MKGESVSQAEGEVAARDRIHIKYCPDPSCKIEGIAGGACKNLDHLLDLVENEAVNGKSGEGNIGMSDGVTYKLNMEHSQCQLTLDVSGAPDTSSPNLPGGPTVRPHHVVLRLDPRQSGWEVYAAQVIGPKVQGADRVTKRDYDVTFSSPNDPDSNTPDWLLKVGNEWVARLGKLDG